MHSGGGVGKSTVISYLIQELKSMGKLMLCTCPTGSGAVLLTKGFTFHHEFKENTLSLGLKTIRPSSPQKTLKFCSTGRMLS